MGKLLVVLPLIGLVGGGVVLGIGLSDDDVVALAGGLVAAASLPLLIAAVALSGYASNRARRAKTQGRGTVLDALQTGPWVNEMPAIALELQVTVDGESFMASTKARLPNFHVQVGLLQPGAEIPVLVDGVGAGADVEVDFETWDAERAGQVRSDPSEPSSTISREAPPVGAHVVDGVRRPVRLHKVVVFEVIAVALLMVGGLAWLDDGALWGLGAALAGMLLMSMVASAVIVGQREGVTWDEKVERAWPDEVGTAEVLEVWRIGDLGYQRVHGFVLRVYAGGSQWEVRIHQAVPRGWLGLIDKGAHVTVRADPDNQRKVAIDWAASTPVVSP